MTDPAEVAQQTAQAAQHAQGMVDGAVSVGVIGALAKGAAMVVNAWRKARSSEAREKRADVQAAADEWQEQYHDCRGQLAEVRTEMGAMRASITALEERQRQEHAPCRAVEAAQQEQIDRLSKEVDVMKRAIDGLLSETPRHGIHPDEVAKGVERLRAAEAQEEPQT